MSAAVRSVVAAPVCQPSPVSILRERLEDLTRLVLALPAGAYRARTSRVSGSIGEHVRHVLDHISSLVMACPATALSYDHRARGTAVETEPGAAVSEMMRLDAMLERWGRQRLDDPVAVISLVSADGQAVTGWSTLARELAFVMSHTIHHQAIVALLVEQQGGDVPDDRFGCAPSTPRGN